PGLPAVSLQEVSGRGQHVRHAALEVATAIAVEVDGVLVVAGGQKLCVSDFAGPTAAHLCDRQVAALEDAQGIEQMASEKIRSPAIVGQCRQRAQDRILAARVGAKVGLKAPD